MPPKKVTYKLSPDEAGYLKSRLSDYVDAHLAKDEHGKRNILASSIDKICTDLELQEGDQYDRVATVIFLFLFRIPLHR